MEKSFPLDELINIDELQSIQDSFARAAGISSVILSPEGKPLTKFTNPTGFCSLIQSTGKGKERCFKSFMEMGKIALGSEEQKIFYCFAHSGNFVGPIMINGEHKGTIFAGQFTPEKFSPEQLHDLEEIAVEIDLDPGLLVKEAEKMRVVGEDVIRNYSDLLFKIVETIARRGAQAADLSRAKDALQRSYDELEKRVQERTAKLAEANKGLEQKVAELKRAEAAIKESEERYKSFFVVAMDGILITDLETKKLKYANPALCKMLGYSAEELKGMSVSDIHPKDKLEHVIFEFEAQSRVERTLTQDMPCLRKDGTIIYADINTTSGSVDGKNCNIGLFRDNSERKAAEEVLKKKADELEKFNKLAVGRELKMIKLKKEVNALLEKSGKEPIYKIVGESQAEVF